MRQVHETAEKTGLFRKGDIKVRIRPYTLYSVDKTTDDFIHVFGNIMQGRNQEQKLDLSRQIIAKLKSLFPDVKVISMNVFEFEKSTYCNRNML
jgi:5-carboxymethyl-2-hydroxymuconate isomerase